MGYQFKRFWAIVGKETIQTIRDWPTLLMMITMPIIELIFISYLGGTTLEHMPTVVADMSHDSASRAFLSALEVSGFFDMTYYVESENDVIQAIDEDQAYVGVVIPPNFAGEVERGTAQALVIVDGSDSFIVQSAYSSASTIAQAHGMDIMMEKLSRMGVSDMADLPLYTSTRILYNPSINELIFLIPGMAAMLLQLIAVNATVMSVVRERELGTMEQILVTPTRPFELIVGKMIPPVGLVVVDLVLIIAMGVYWFKVPFKGSVGLFSWLSLLFIISGLGMGLLLSTIVNSQKQAQQIAALIMMLTMLLTGLIYPRSTMPPVIQFVGNLIPATYFIRIARGIITKGVGLTFLWQDVVALVIYGVVILTIAAATFRRRLD
ncbi:MAG: ABC transporter permease [Anaerolineae bacterium]|nr:ABC transporter permease [Anaerolineae bacterium]